MELQLKAIRANADYSLEELAKKLGYSKSSVWRWEHQLAAIPAKAFDEYCLLCGADQKTVESLRRRLKIKDNKNERK